MRLFIKSGAAVLEWAPVPVMGQEPVRAYEHTDLALANRETLG